MGQFGRLSGLVGAHDSELGEMRICIVTPALRGPVKNSGIGNACAYLAHALAEAGNRVTVLYSNDRAGNIDWQRDYQKRGIQVAVLQKRDPQKFFPAFKPLIAAYAVYDWLCSQPDFDQIIFMDWQANGFYALQAKKSCQRFLSTSFVVIVHCPSFWHAVHNANHSRHPQTAILWHMERSCAEMADAVISPSDYMLGWCQKHGFKFPHSTYVQPNLLTISPAASAPAAGISEVVFFGRLEYRKGLAQFCDALDLLAKTGSLPPKVTFLGESGFMGREHALLYIGRRAARWKNCDLNILLRYDQIRALEYLKTAGRLAVMPSVAENSPYAVYECLVAKIPFIARDCGGTGELVKACDRERVLVGQTPRELAEKIRAALDKTPESAQPDFDLSANVDSWTRGLAVIARDKSFKCRTGVMPCISVCLCHHNRPVYLKQAIRSFLSQDYGRFELVLVDDGSDDANALKCLDELEPLFLQKNWKILRLPNSYVGRARNEGARVARGEWLLFFDDDNIAKPEMLRICAKTAASRDDGLITFMFDVFDGVSFPSGAETRERFLPCGSIIAYSALLNAISDATAMVHKRTFEDLGGFSEDYGVGHEDFEFYLRLVLAGKPVYVIPESLFWYRRSSESMIANTNSAANRMRSLRPFMEMLAPEYAELALMCHGMAEEHGLYKSAETELPASLRDIWKSENPETPEQLEIIGDYLQKQGCPRLGRQIRDWAIISNFHDGYGYMALGIKEASRHGDMEEVRRKCENFELALKTLPEKIQKEEKNKLDTMLLEYLPKTYVDLRDRIVNELVMNKHVPGMLMASLAMAESSVEKSMKYFFRSLLEAERIYLANRTDVEIAVKEGKFICGLHHFALYGKNEGMEWPDKYYFSKIFSGFKEFIQYFIVGHMYLYNYNAKELSIKMAQSLF